MSDETQPPQVTGPLATRLPPNHSRCQQLLAKLQDKRIAVREVASCIAEDPALSLQIMKAANAANAGPRTQEVTTIKTAVVSLGVDQLRGQLEAALQYDIDLPPPVLSAYEEYSGLCVKAAHTARILSNVALKSVAEDAFVLGLFGFLGDMIGILHFGQEYLALQEKYSKRGKINYYLLRNFNFELEHVQISYLALHGLPASRHTLMQRDSEIVAPEAQKLKSIYFCAVEMVEAHLNDKFEVYAPSARLPSKSYFRLLKLTEIQQAKLYNEIGEYLSTGALLLEAEPTGPSQFLESDEPETAISEKEQLEQQKNEIAAEVTELSQGAIVTKDENSSAGVEDYFEYDGEVLTHTDSDRTIEVEVGSSNPVVIVSSGSLFRPKRIEPPPLRNDRIKSVDSLAAPFVEIIEAAERIEELLPEVLELLVQKKYFYRAALLATEAESKRAFCLVGRGEIPESNDGIVTADPRSPLYRNTTKVESFGSKNNPNSPFGSRAYALAPLDVKYRHAVVLYADCGEELWVSFDARRVFRRVVTILNEKLPELPGTLPE